MPCTETAQKTSRRAAQERLERAGKADNLSPALIAQAQASLASALSLSDLLTGRRA